MTRGGERTVGIVLLVGTVLCVAAAVVYARAQIGEEVARDRRHCPVEVARMKRWTMVLVDRTDRFSPVQAEELKGVVERVAEGMAQDEGLSLHVLGGKAEDAAEPFRGFALCKPRDPKSVNAVTETVSFVRKDYERVFAGPLDAVVAELVKGGAAARSPILEALDVALWFPRFRAAGEGRVVVYSDFLQHTAGLSQLKGGFGDPCGVVRSELGERLSARLKGLSVVLHYRMNADYRQVQGAEHLQWWSRVFYALGAGSVHDGERLMPKRVGDCAEKAPRKGGSRQKAR